MELAAALLERWGRRLRQVHPSGIEPDSARSPATEEGLERYAPSLERCGGVPLIPETTLTWLW